MSSSSNASCFPLKTFTFTQVPTVKSLPQDMGLYLDMICWHLLLLRPQSHLFRRQYQRETCSSTLRREHSPMTKQVNQGQNFKL